LSRIAGDAIGDVNQGASITVQAGHYDRPFYWSAAEMRERLTVTTPARAHLQLDDQSTVARAARIGGRE
jgi:hypothetical protein